MGIVYGCPYCNWQRVEPSAAEYENAEDYLKAITEFNNDQANHPCNK